MEINHVLIFRHSRYLFAVAAMLVSSSVPALAATTPSAKLATLAESYYENRLKLFSLWATEDVGDPRFEGELQIEIAPPHRAAQATFFSATLKEIKRVPTESLSTEERLTIDVLQYDATTRLEALQYPRHLLPINQIDTVPVKLAQWAGGQSVQPFKTVQNYDNFLRRIDRLPAWVDQAIVNMREGMQKGITQPRSLIERALPQLETLAATTPEKSAFFSPIDRLPASFSSGDKARLTAAYRNALAERVLPAQAKLLAFVRNEYLPKARATAGLGALPDGDAWYRHAVRESITSAPSAPRQYTRWASRKLRAFAAKWRR